METFPAFRPFGLYESDLNVDFERTPRPVLVTQLLECCTRTAQQSVDEHFLWELPVGKRIECLVTLLVSANQGHIPLAVRCPDPACNEISEIETSMEELAALQDEAYATDPVTVRLGDETVTLRRPTGRDQLNWLGGNLRDPAAVLQTMVRTLLLSASESVELDRWLGTIEQAMEEHDPLVNFTVRVKCPGCESEHFVTVDLVELTLQRLRDVQLRLLGTVHRLAGHYHWSEAQIFAVPHWRRAQYLNLIDNEPNQ